MKNYIDTFTEGYGLCDEAEVLLIKSQQWDLVKNYIDTFTGGYGLCDEAELLLVESQQWDLVRMYTKFIESENLQKFSVYLITYLLDKGLLKN